MARSFIFLLVVLLAVQGFASVVREEQIARLLPEDRANTVTTYVTTTATTPTTSILNTTFYCATSSDGASALPPCARKRQLWGAPLILALDEGIDQFNPTPILRIEPSALPEYRNRLAPSVIRPVAQYASPFAIQSTQDKTVPVQFRVADPFFGASRYSAFSSLFSNIISSILTPAVTVTRTSTVYTTTTTKLSYTTTSKFELVGCIPSVIALCTA